MALDLLGMLGSDDMEEGMGDLALVDIEVEKAFARSLEEDTITLDEILENAPWNQLEVESETQYDAFKFFVNLPIDDWEPEHITKFRPDIESDTADWWSKEFDWKERRMAYVKYQEWLRRKQDEIKHQEGISDFRDTQVSLLRSSSKATVNLINKLTQRIEELDPSEIKATDIPKFVSAVSEFIEMTTDTQAKLLTLNELLALYADDLDAQAIREHINQAGDTKLKPNAK